MLTQPTPQALIALEQIAKFPRWSDVDKMLQGELDAILDRIIGARADADLHALRGRAAALKELQQLVRDAPAMLVKQGIRSPLS